MKTFTEIVVVSKHSFRALSFSHGEIIISNSLFRSSHRFFLLSKNVQQNSKNRRYFLSSNKHRSILSSFSPNKTRKKTSLSNKTKKNTSKFSAKKTKTPPVNTNAPLATKKRKKHPPNPPSISAHLHQVPSAARRRGNAHPPAALPRQRPLRLL